MKNDTDNRDPDDRAGGAEDGGDCAPTNETSGRKCRGAPFAKGESGNPKGRPRGSKNKIPALLAALVESNVEAIGEKAIELALAGNPGMIKFFLSRHIPPFREPIPIVEMPELTSPAACREAKARIAKAAGAGEISGQEAYLRIKIVDAVAESFNRFEGEAAFEHKRADAEMVRLLAKYPHSHDPGAEMRNFNAFVAELDALSLPLHERRRLWLQYYDCLRPATIELMNANDGDGKAKSNA